MKTRRKKPMTTKYLAPLWLFAMILFAATINAWAGPTEKAAGSQAGLNRIDENIVNAQGNLDDYKSQLGTVEKNLGEIAKAKAAVGKQGAEISKLEKDNTQMLKSLRADEAKVQEQIQKEKQALTNEEKKLAELEALVQKIKANRATREANISAHQQSLQQLEDNRKVYEQKGQALAASREQNKKQAREVSALEKEWSNKRQGYEGEIKRWDTEVGKQKNLREQMQDLAAK